MDSLSMITLLKAGYPMTLPNWDRDEFIYYTEGSTVNTTDLRGNIKSICENNSTISSVKIHPHIDKMMKNNEIEIGYKLEFEEILSDKWEVHKPAVRIGNL